MNNQQAQLPEGWELKKLGEVCEIIGGGTPSKKNAKFYDGDIFWATVRDMKSDLISDTEFKISDEAVKNSSTKVIPKGNVIIATRVGLGKICRIKNNTAINQDLRGIVPKKTKQLDIGYLFHWFKSISYIIVAEGKGATVQGVTLPFIKNLEIPLPPLPEQQRIVSILDECFAAIDKAKANAEQNLRNAKELFESYLQGVFEKKGDGWEEKKLSDLFDVKHGFAFLGEFFSNNGEYVLLTPGNFFEEGGYKDRGDKQKYYNGIIPPDFILKKGDLLVAMTEQASGLLGSPIIVPESDKFLHNQRLGLIVPKPDVEFENEFFFHIFNLKKVRKYLHDSGTGVKVRHTSPTKIGQIEISYPESRKKQQAIVRQLDALRSETQKLGAVYQKKINDLEELKKSILRKAFAGELTTEKELVT